MNSNDLTRKFNEVYDNTYDCTLKLVISKCDNISSVEDIVQDVYSEIYENNDKKKGLNYIVDYNKFIYNLARKKLFKYYNLKSKF